MSCAGRDSCHALAYLNLPVMVPMRALVVFHVRNALLVTIARSVRVYRCCNREERVDMKVMMCGVEGRCKSRKMAE